MSVAREPPFAAGRPVTQAALAWAATLHRGQRRDVDGAPFILHPLEVAALLSGRGYHDEVVAARLPDALARHWTRCAQQRPPTRPGMAVRLSSRQR